MNESAARQQFEEKWLEEFKQRHYLWNKKKRFTAICFDLKYAALDLAAYLKDHHVPFTESELIDIAFDEMVEGGQCEKHKH